MNKTLLITLLIAVGIIALLGLKVMTSPNAGETNTSGGEINLTTEPSPPKIGQNTFIIDVKEDKDLVEKSFGRFHFSFPVLLDADGKVSASYAPVGVQPALERHEVPIASNLIIDKDGTIRFYSLLNTAGFDAKLTNLKQKLDGLMDARK